MSNITAQSTPDFDMPFNPFDSSWSMQDWITWHKALKSEYGKDRAIEILVDAWEKQSIWSFPYNWWKYNDTWVSYWKSEGYDVGHTLSKVVNASGQIVETVTKDAATISKVLVPLAIVAVGAYALTAINTFKK